MSDTMNKKEWYEHVGCMEQVAYARRSTLSEGPGKGMEIIHVRCGALTFDILPDRGMDIGNAFFRGVSIGYMSKTGLASPFLAEREGLGFLKSFSAGLLTTCGLRHFGASCEDNGEHFGLHGDAGYHLADHISISCSFEEEDYVICITGIMKDSKVFGPHIRHKREIITILGDDRIKVKDTIENVGFDDEALMLLYHCNIGYPMIDSDMVLRLGDVRTECRDAIAEKGVGKCEVMQSPTYGFAEEVYFHQPIESGRHTVELDNRKLNLNLQISYDADSMPYLVEWKQMGQGDYVLGIEPATWKTYGRRAARDVNELTMIEPFESKDFEVEFAFGGVEDVTSGD